MGFDIVTMGPLLVEVIRTERDKPLCEPGFFAGPFASGDTPIFIDAAAKLGMRCGFIGVAGGDDFGRCVVGKLERDGVDVTQVRFVSHKTTSVTFVAYASDGSRSFLYHVRDAAGGLLCADDVKAGYLQGAKWLHVTGFSLSGSKTCEEAFHRALDLVSDDAKVSFDPNIRPELLSVDQIRKLCGRFLERAEVVFPSANEASMFTGASNDDEGCRIWQKKGKLVVLKRGVKGCRIFGGDGVTDVPTYPVTEVDPTGAGDAFCAAFLTGLIEGKPPREAARFANAVGALSVRKMGPMEGIPAREEVERFLLSKGVAR